MGISKIFYFIDGYIEVRWDKVSYYGMELGFAFRFVFLLLCTLFFKKCSFWFGGGRRDGGIRRRV